MNPAVQDQWRIPSRIRTMFCMPLSVTLDEWAEFRKGEDMNDCLEGFNTKRLDGGV